MASERRPCPVHGHVPAAVAISRPNSFTTIRSSEYMARFIETNRVCIRIAPEPEDYNFLRNLISAVISAFTMKNCAGGIGDPDGVNHGSDHHYNHHSPTNCSSEGSRSPSCCDVCFQAQPPLSKFDQCQAMSFSCPCDCNPIVIPDKSKKPKSFHIANALCNCRCEL